MIPLSGFLLGSPERTPIRRDMLEIAALDGGGVPALRFKGYLFGLRQWEEYELVTDVILIEEGQADLSEGPPYRYRLVGVRSGSKVIILSDKKKVSSYAIARLLDQRIFPNLRRININIPSLIDHLLVSSSSYYLTTLHGHFAAGDRQLKSISLYGDDITSASFFRNNIKFFSFFSCGLGRRLTGPGPRLSTSDDEKEIMLVGNDGFISALVRDREHAKEIMLLVQYLVKHRWVNDWVAGPEEATSQ